MRIHAPNAQKTTQMAENTQSDQHQLDPQLTKKKREQNNLKQATPDSPANNETHPEQNTKHKKRQSKENIKMMKRSAKENGQLTSTSTMCKVSNQLRLRHP